MLSHSAKNRKPNNPELLLDPYEQAVSDGGKEPKTPQEGEKKPPTEPGSGRAAICLDRLGGSGNEGGEGQQEKLGWGWDWGMGLGNGFWEWDWDW